MGEKCHQQAGTSSASCRGLCRLGEAAMSGGGGWGARHRTQEIPRPEGLGRHQAWCGVERPCGHLRDRSWLLP